MQKFTTLFLLFSLIILSPATVQAQSGRLPAPAKNGMVVSSHYLASEVGSEVLKQGGNAVDAAIATAFALAVTLPSAGNIGGGGFLVYHGADGYTTSFNFREKAPLAATPTMYLGADGKIKNNSNHRGALSVGVPGTVAGLAMAHERLGTMEWRELVAPAVTLAEEGFPSTWAMQDFLRVIQQRAAQYPTTAEAILKPGNEMYEPGEIWKQPDLARTLKRIQEEGRDGFYKGETAQLFVDYMKDTGGIIALEDLASYEAVEQPVIHGTYRGYDIYGMAPPSSGGTALVTMLNMLEAYDLEEMGHNSADYLHLLTEVMRRAFADRAMHLGDPLFNPDMPIERLTSKEHAASLRSTINMERASESDSSSFSMTYESEETTHFSVVDAEGNAVSLTYTLEWGYGSWMVVDGAGFFLNNEMGDFNPMPGVTTRYGQIGTPPNLIAPEKRMLSSMTPTILAKDGKPLLVIGTPGGRTIINTVLQVVLNVLDHGMDVGQAIEAGRIHHQWLPDMSRVEDFALSPDTRKLYEAKGHRLQFRQSMGRAMGIYIDPETGMRYGAADSRSFDGRAVGY